MSNLTGDLTGPAINRIKHTLMSRNRIPQIFAIIFIFSQFPLFSHEQAENYRRLFAEPSVATHLQLKLEALAANPDYKIAGEKFHNIEYITHLYQKNSFQAFWTKLQFADDAVEGIIMSYEDGLIPLDYHLERILVTKNDLIQNGVINEKKIIQAAELELLLTDGIIFYADHLLYGKVDPVTLLPTWNFGFAPVPEINPESFKKNIEGGRIPEQLQGLRPDVFLYDTLVAALAKYREIESRGGWGMIPVGGKIEPGNRDPRIPQIRKRLLTIGYASQPDSTESDLYDKILEIDIRKFQSAHGLDADGIVGAGTLREMNVPVTERIAAIRINLERIRWVAHNLPKSYLIVNIAAFWLVLVEDGNIVHQANVVVGKPYNKTPVFRDKMRYIDFNPTWTVPSSIIKNEIIPKLKKDSLYLQKNNMILLDSKGNEVPVSQLDIPNLSPGRFPYLVRQQPGPENALGVVKFMFPNEYDIYLHDTPSKTLFRKASRAFSHGCIRVEKPLDLAEKLLKGTEWDRQKIDQVVKTQKTTRVLLPEKLDVLLMYWTCGLDRNRNVFFVPDIYGRDPDVLKELDRLLR
jgi:murein L,D-transpeptidase YcbB/YkuD